MGREQEARKDFSCSASPLSREHKIIKQMLVMSGLMEVYGNLRDLSNTRISHNFSSKTATSNLQTFPFASTTVFIQQVSFIKGGDWLFTFIL